MSVSQCARVGRRSRRLHKLQLIFADNNPCGFRLTMLGLAIAPIGFVSEQEFDSGVQGKSRTCDLATIVRDPTRARQPRSFSLGLACRAASSMTAR
jgi:hypothetical protein